MSDSIKRSIRYADVEITTGATAYAGWYPGSYNYGSLNIQYQNFIGAFVLSHPASRPTIIMGDGAYKIRVYTDEPSKTIPVRIVYMA